MDYRKNKIDIRGEYQHQRIENPINGYTYYGTQQLHNNDFIAGRIGYKFTERLYGYIRGQGTVTGLANNQGTVGTDIEIWENTLINLAETVGNLGDSTLLGVTSRIGEDREMFASVENGTNSGEGRFTKTSFGQTLYISPAAKAYVKTDYSSYKEGLIRGEIVGYERKVSDNLSFDISYERSHIERDPEAISRDAGSISLSYLNIDQFRLITKLECREDHGSNATRQWLTENEAMWYITKDISLIGKANYSITDDRVEKETAADYKEFGIGCASRPIKFDRLNLLARYTYLEDKYPDSQSDFPLETEDRSHVYAGEGAFDICRYLQIVGKIAYKINKEKVEPRDFINSDTHLYIGRLNFHITNKWDIGGEYRILSNTQTEDRREGWFVRAVGKY